MMLSQIDENLANIRADQVEAYPTEAREREKARDLERTQKGLEKRKAKKRKQEVEQHFDDLGDCSAGLGGDLALLSADVYIGVEEADPEQPTVPMGNGCATGDRPALSRMDTVSTPGPTGTQPFHLHAEKPIFDCNVGNFSVITLVSTVSTCRSPTDTSELSTANL